jgi:hypothetical protein
MKHIISLLILIGLLNLFQIRPAHAQSANSLSLADSTQSVEIGQNIKVTLQGNVTTPSQGFNLQLRYDPTCLQLLKHTPTGLLPAEAYPVETVSDGLLDVAYTLLGGAKTFNGSGALLKIEFKTLKTCQTNLSLENAKLMASDEQGLAYYVDTELGAPLSVTIVSTGVVSTPQPPSAPTALPVTAQPSATSQSTWIAYIGAGKESAFSWSLVATLGLLTLTASLASIGLMLRLRVPQRPTPISYPISTPTLYEAQPVHTGPSIQIELGAQPVLVPLHTSPFNIGRDVSNQLNLPNPLISRSHAQLFQIGADWYISDNHSRNGTFVNDQRIQQPLPLRPGDQIRLGRQVLMRFG